MEKLILAKFKDLPPELQRQVLDFIEFLLARYKSQSPSQEPEEEKAETSPPPDDLPELLKKALLFKGDAPHLNFILPKTAWYEQ